ncbi:hypothetical protein Ms3S1_14260 [Methylosinus sp. 3S-1]
MNEIVDQHFDIVDFPLFDHLLDHVERAGQREVEADLHLRLVEYGQNRPEEASAAPEHIEGGGAVRSHAAARIARTAKRSRATDDRKDFLLSNLDSHSFLLREFPSYTYLIAPLERSI